MRHNRVTDWHLAVKFRIGKSNGSFFFFFFFSQCLNLLNFPKLQQHNITVLSLSNMCNFITVLTAFNKQLN